MYFQRKNRSDRDVLFIYLLLQINLFPVPATKEQCLAGCETRVSLQSDLVFHEENCFLLSVTLRVWLVQDDEIVLRQVGAYLLAGAISFNGLTDGLMDSSSRSAPSSPDSVAR